MRALISCSDKTGLVDFAKGLDALGVEIISTGGTLDTLRKEGIAAVSVSDVTQFPECMDGRLKTLHPKIHGGILAIRDNPQHVKDMTNNGIKGIDLVVVNLYPFKQTIAKPGVSFEEAIENIDIGGPAMLRAAAKNYRDVIVVVDPADYEMVLDGLQGKALMANARSAALKVKALRFAVLQTGVKAKDLSVYLKKLVCTWRKKFLPIRLLTTPMSPHIY